MSDFFIGGLLVFSLLLPILLRPFFRGMHALGGIPVLAVPAVFLCAGLLVTGTRLLFFPLFAFTVLVLLSQTGRMISLARGLPSDWFSAGTKALSVLEDDQATEEEVTAAEAGLKAAMAQLTASTGGTTETPADTGSSSSNTGSSQNNGAGGNAVLPIHGSAPV